MNQCLAGTDLGLTPKQGQYLAFIDAYTRVNRRSPAEWEMQRHFGVTPPSVHQMILALERAGFIGANPEYRAASKSSSHPRTYLSCKPPSNRSKPLRRGTSAF